MTGDTIRIGVVGAGGNTQLRHIPGFQTQEDVEMVSICNRTRESSQRIASKFGIPRVYDTWKDLIEADDIDAVCIGTWPYLHAPITIAALEAGKHVLTEARMALNANEARAMLAASRKNPSLVAQVVPAPLTFKVDATIRRLLAEDYVGSILAIELRGTQNTFAEQDSLLHWRQDSSLSGYNILNLGIWYETLMRWVGPARRIMAMTQVTVKKRYDQNGQLRIIEVPDHVDVLCGMACGAQAHIRVSAVTGLADPGEVWIFGSTGTLKLELAHLGLYGGKKGEDKLSEIIVPAEEQAIWRVEEEFINAVRGKESVRLTTFEDGVRYMDFTEAVARSSENGCAVNLPLNES
jgi:predicted dehydrogenase